MQLETGKPTISFAAPLYYNDNEAAVRFCALSSGRMGFIISANGAELGGGLGGRGGGPGLATAAAGAASEDDAPASSSPSDDAPPATAAAAE